MKIIVSGGRNYKDFKKVSKVLEYLKPNDIIVGDCPTGVDAMVVKYIKGFEKWFKQIIDYKIYEADWDQYGKAAGPFRNQKMCQENTDANFLIAFPGGKGTHNCIEETKKLGIIVLKVE